MPNDCCHWSCIYCSGSITCRNAGEHLASRCPATPAERGRVDRLLAERDVADKADDRGRVQMLSWQLEREWDMIKSAHATN